MPKLALISPKGVDYANDKKLASFLKDDPRMKNIQRMWSSPNLGLLVLATLTPSNWEIFYIDEYHREIDFDVEYDLVGISCMTQQVERGCEISRQFRSRGITTVIGGIHATVFPEDVQDEFDSVIIGEGELLWPQFIKDWENKSLKKHYREENAGCYDITESPIPRYDLIQDYPYSTITISTSRGCNHDCSFCAASRVYGSVYRRKSNKQIINEIKEIKRYFPDRYILFGDDNIFVSRRDSKELLHQIKGLNIRWAAQTDISIADDQELLQLMAESGCIWVVIGLESISEENLKGVEKWKGERVHSYRENIQLIQKFGIGVLGAFVFGLDADDQNMMQKTIDFINGCNFYGIHVTTPTPFPGTRFRKEMKEQGRLLDKPWSFYTHWDVIIKPKQMTPEELSECILKIYQNFSSEDNTNRRFTNFIKAMREQNRSHQ